jgi:GTP diphosphokinase / guanosine-3',5'-bis(diphosphate) 3'-diphosphatase
MKDDEKIFEKLTTDFISYGKNDQDREKLKKTWEFVKVAHHGQLRKSGERFVVHPLMTARYLVDWKMDLDTVVAGFLHDSVEHGAASKKDLIEQFGEEVAALVDGVTNVSKFKLKGSEKEQFVENLRKMFLAMAKDLRVIIIRLAERLHNMQTISFLPEERKKRYAQDTLEIYAPLAERLGMGSVKSELEDLSFSIIFPNDYKSVKEKSRRFYDRVEMTIEKMKQKITKTLEGENIQATVSGRRKSLYSIWKKLERPGIDWDFDKIYDIMALRILVNDDKECYTVLGVIHKIFKPAIQYGFSDFIAQPKTNGYRSIHTKVFSPENNIVEIQIRTWEMHSEAEYGVAAHWAYSEERTR